MLSAFMMTSFFCSPTEAAVPAVVTELEVFKLATWPFTYLMSDLLILMGITEDYD
jgi:hypothetical protein